MKIAEVIIMKENDIVRIHGGKYNGCILTWIRSSPLGQVVVIEGIEKCLECTTSVSPYCEEKLERVSKGEMCPLSDKSRLCPKCNSDNINHCHHNGTFAVPECNFYHCEDCQHQWDHA